MDAGPLPTEFPGSWGIAGAPVLHFLPRIPGGFTTSGLVPVTILPSTRSTAAAPCSERSGKRVSISARQRPISRSRPPCRA